MKKKPIVPIDVAAENAKRKKTPKFSFEKDYILTHNGKDAVIDTLPKMEVCARCGKITDVPRDMNIELRKNYVEGVGQLCGLCANEIYNTRLP